MAIDATHIISLFENATEGIILTNGKGDIILANPAAEKMFGYKDDEIIGKPIEILIPDHLRSPHGKHRTEFYHKPQNRSMGIGRDLYGRRKDGANLPVEISLSHYNKKGELFVIAFIVDITKRKEIENDLLRQKKELEKISNDIRKLNAELEGKVEERTLILKEALQKLEKSQKELSEALNKEKELSEIKSRFVSMASHEFRTPLSTVLSSASLLTKYTSAEDQVNRNRHIDKIKSSVKQLNDILEDFLSLGKLDEGKVMADPDKFDLKALLAETADEMKVFLKKDQHILIEHSGYEELYSDKKLLKNIIINLLSNAIKFSDEGSAIDLKSKTDKEQTTIEVSDHGIGISETDKQHLFSSFFRGANASNIQGTGLGLHIVKRYADLLNGTVNLQSQINKGTTIILKIPKNQR